MHRSMTGLIPLVAVLLACPADDSDTGGGPTDGGSASAETTAATDTTVADPTADSGTGTGAEATGEELYGQLCSPCHGPSGEGSALGYELQHPVREFSTWVVRNGRPGDEFEGSVMAAYSPDTVSDAQLEQMWDFLDAFPQPTTGEALYLDYCANCHGADASGGVVSKDISDKTFGDSQERVREGAGLGDPGSRMLYMPAFDIDTVSDDELQLMMDHIAGL